MNIQGKATSISRYEKAAAVLYRKYGYNEFTAKQFMEAWGKEISNFNYKDYGLGNFEKIYKWKDMFEFVQMEAPPAPRTPDFTKVCFDDLVKGYTKRIARINTPYRSEKNELLHYQYSMLIQHIHSMKCTDPTGETFHHYYYMYSLNPEFFEGLKEIKSQLKTLVQYQIQDKLAKLKEEYAKIEQLAMDFEIEDCLEEAPNI